MMRALAWTLCFLVTAALGRGDTTPDPLARPGTRLGPGFTIGLAVSVDLVEEKELCGAFPLDSRGRIHLTVGYLPIDPIDLTGLTAQEAERKVRDALAKYYVGRPEVRLVITRVSRIRVVAQGATFRNGPVEVAQGARLTDFIAQVGYQPAADLERVAIRRVERDGTRITLNANVRPILEGAASDPNNDPVLQEGDQIQVALRPLPPVIRTIAVLGEVRSPGYYTYRPGMTVLDALFAAQDLLPTADAARVTITRASSRAFLTVNADRARERIPTENLVLQPDDVIYVATRDTGRRYAVAGAVAAPGTFDHPGKVTLSQALEKAGGFKPNADRGKVTLVKGMLSDPTRAEQVVVNYDRIVRNEVPDIPLEAGDVIQVPERRRGGVSLQDVGMWLLRIFLF